MPHIYALVVLAIAAAGTTVWIYCGVPRRVVANWAICLGMGLAALDGLLWLFFAEGTPFQVPSMRVAGGLATGLGIAAGGLLAHLLYGINCPDRRNGC